MSSLSLTAKAIRRGLLTVAATAVATTSTFSVSAAEEAQVDKVERIEVTGSRIKRTDLEGSSPITTIDAAAIEKTGEMSVADVLRRSNLNTFGSFSESSGSTWQSQSNINLRGAGADRTLVLLNGKRMPGSPTMGGTAVNLNTIPTAAIARIEVLTDGASAVYGSDAVAGVVNIITKKGYEGVEVSATMTNPQQAGGEEWKTHVVGGVNSDKGSMTFSFEHQNRDIIYQRDRWFTSSTNVLAPNYGDTTGVSAYARNFLDMTTFQFSPMDACNNDKMVGGGHVYDYGDGDFICGYDYTSEAANHASRGYTAGYVNADYEISDEITFIGQGLFSRNETFGRFAPAAGWFNVDAGQIDIQNYDENGNYLGTSKNENAGRTYYRFTDVGTRDSTTIDYSTDIQIGLEGSHDDFGWDFTYHYNLAENSNYGSGYVHRPTVEALVKSGDFNFGPEGNNAAVVASISHDVLAQDIMEFQSVNAGINFEAFELPAGTVGFYFGTEFAQYKYTSKVDAESAAGEVIGSSGNGSGGDRDVFAVFGESIIPVTDDLEFNVALRFDDYSDFGNATTPKVALRYNIVDDLVLRASWGQGFRAPALTDLYAADSYSADYATDYHVCELAGTAPVDCPSAQYDVTRTANSELEAETSDFYNMGLIWNLTDDLSAKAEYYHLSVDNVIQFVSLDSLLKEEASVGYGNLSRGEIIRAGDNADGKILEATTPQVNGNGFDTSGIDFNITYTGLETAVGDFGTTFDLTWVLAYNDEEYFDGPVNDQIGRNGLPEYRFTWVIDWSYGDHAASLLTQYIDGQAETIDPETYAQVGKLNSQTTFDASYSYSTSWNGKFGLGVRNITNEDPVLDSNLAYDSALYNLYGRTYTASYTQKF
ncbi:TonB-dependent receptor plug domain-containing protein [Shewanella sp. 10N.286.48.B5]|uniref:TonB-dependent receptor plug domain-containing protein n=1 Tax=Shewanella sp. 10N.286.48.B5 TaxID=1880834 RepID=UPI000C8666B1|nr:TonB-dependent receptor [Shewanella sp. 10N.286.48.B5]PMH84645.1 TonB-dependent receptor [Shewanella sp. 10N.286.48.B5]